MCLQIALAFFPNKIQQTNFSNLQTVSNSVWKMLFYVLTSSVVKTIFSMEEKYLSHSTWVCWRSCSILYLEMDLTVLGTWSSRRSSAQMTALFQSITWAKGSTQPLDSSTGMHPACKASKKRKEPKRRPLGTKQNVEFWSNTS